jgi:hypothetical protein
MAINLQNDWKNWRIWNSVTSFMKELYEFSPYTFPRQEGQEINQPLTEKLELPLGRRVRCGKPTSIEVILGFKVVRHEPYSHPGLNFSEKYAERLTNMGEPPFSTLQGFHQQIPEQFSCTIFR